MAPNLTPTRAENAGKIYLKEAVVERQSFGLGFRLLLPEDREESLRRSWRNNHQHTSFRKSHLWAFCLCFPTQCNSNETNCLLSVSWMEVCLFFVFVQLAPLHLEVFKEVHAPLWFLVLFIEKGGACLTVVRTRPLFWEAWKFLKVKFKLPQK